MNMVTRQQALAAGLLRYRTGKLCRHGHIAERYVSTMQCVECIAAQSRAWREANPVASASIHAAWRKRHPQKVRKWKSASQMRHRAAANVRDARYRATHREQINARIAAWQKANPSRELAKVRRRQAAKLHRTPSWADHAAIGMVYQAAQIARATWPEVEIHVDHVVPLRGRTVSGLHVHRNLQIVTGRSNRSKAIHF
jgi:hypothetical protein